jgi:hypothetical protein
VSLITYHIVKKWKRSGLGSGWTEMKFGGD